MLPTRRARVVPRRHPAPALANPVTDYVPSARPGARALACLARAQRVRISTIDLVGFVILAGRRGAAWVRAARQLAPDMGPTLRAHNIGDGEIENADGQWHAAYGVDERMAPSSSGPTATWPGCSRSLRREPVATLRAALAAILAPP